MLDPAHPAGNLRSVQISETHKAWGEKVRHEREKKGWTIARLAAESGVHETTILRIERGTLIANDDLKWKLAGIFQARMDWLWAWPTITPPIPEAVAS